MKLNQNGTIARYYKWFYMTDELPTNLCPFFWWLALSLLLAVVMMPTIAIYRKMRELKAPYVEWIIAGVFLWVAILAVVALIIHFVTNPIGTSIFAGIALSVAFITFITTRKSEAIKESKRIVAEKLRSAKEGYCPRIDWE